MSTSVKCFERNLDFIYRRIVDESVLVPLHNNVADMDCIYTLNGMGAYLWERLAIPATQAELEEAIMAEYDAEPVVLVKDLEKFLAEMVSIGALREV